MSPVVILRDMREDEFVAYSKQQMSEYVQSLTGVLTPDAAVDKARRDWAESLPQGMATDRHRLLAAETAAGQVVGYAWLGLAEPRTKSPETAWLYDLRVESDHRRHGYGSAILTAVEELARRAGALRLGLNVFGSNTAAIALYERAGYAVATQQMVKPLT
jgi:ribosomal protein S18 acetylase RimI-like enzyme